MVGVRTVLRAGAAPLEGHRVSRLINGQISAERRTALLTWKPALRRRLDVVNAAA